MGPVVLGGPSPENIFNSISCHTTIMKFMLILAVVATANCTPLFGGSYLELERNAAGQITDVSVEQADPILKSVAIPARTAPVVTSYAAPAPVVTSYAAAAPAFRSFAPAFAPTIYNAPASNLIYTHAAPTVYHAPSPIVYRAHAPVVYRAPAPVVYRAPAPVVVKAAPQVIVKTVQAPAPAPIIKTVYVDAESTEDEDETIATVYAAADTANDSSEETL